MQIQTVHAEPPAHSSSTSLVEITEEMYEKTSKPLINNNKRKKKAIIDKSLVIRSDRLAKITMGLKDKASAAAANLPSSSQSTAAEKGKKSATTINLGPKFDAMVRDKSAPPPPHLPVHTMQAIGTGPCKMNANDVSFAALNYDNSDD